MSFQKHPRLNTERWTKAVIYMLKANNNFCNVQDIYDNTCVEPSLFTESVLVEHPSLLLKNGAIFYRSFCSVECARDIIDFVRSSMPRCVRLIDLHGLYPFVDEDVQELVFNKKLDFIGESPSLTILPFAKKASSLFMAEWRRD